MWCLSAVMISSEHQLLGSSSVSRYPALHTHSHIHAHTHTHTHKQGSSVQACAAQLVCHLCTRVCEPACHSADNGLARAADCVVDEGNHAPDDWQDAL